MVQRRILLMHDAARTSHHPPPFTGAGTMESIQVAMLTLTAVAVGVLCSVMIQLHMAIRQLRADVAATRARVEPMLDRFNQSSQIATALGVAIAAGAKAYRESQRAAAASAEREDVHV